MLHATGTERIAFKDLSWRTSTLWPLWPMLQAPCQYSACFVHVLLNTPLSNRPPPASLEEHVYSQRGSHNRQDSYVRPYSHIAMSTYMLELADISHHANMSHTLTLIPLDCRCRCSTVATTSRSLSAIHHSKFP